MLVNMRDRRRGARHIRGGRGLEQPGCSDQEIAQLTLAFEGCTVRTCHKVSGRFDGHGHSSIRKYRLWGRCYDLSLAMDNTSVRIRSIAEIKHGADGKVTLGAWEPIEISDGWRSG